MSRSKSIDTGIVSELLAAGHSAKDIAFMLDVPVPGIEAIVAGLSINDPGRQAEEGEPEPKMAPLMSLSSSQCRWPYGDPQMKEDFGFCGHPAERNRPYCAYHCEAAYLKPGDIEKKRRGE